MLRKEGNAYRQASTVLTPTMPIVETIFVNESTGDRDGIADVGPSVTMDTVYPDTFYVQSGKGLGKINIRPALDGAIHGETDGAQSEVSTLITTDG